MKPRTEPRTPEGKSLMNECRLYSGKRWHKDIDPRLAAKFDDITDAVSEWIVDDDFPAVEDEDTGLTEYMYRFEFTLRHGLSTGDVVDFVLRLHAEGNLAILPDAFQVDTLGTSDDRDVVIGVWCEYEE